MENPLTGEHNTVLQGQEDAIVEDGLGMNASKGNE